MNSRVEDVEQVVYFVRRNECQNLGLELGKVSYGHRRWRLTYFTLKQQRP